MAEVDTDDLISLIEDESCIDEIPASLPLMPARDIVIFTDMLMPLFVGRRRSIKAIEDAAAKEGYLFISAQKDSSVENPKPEEIYRTGTISRILRLLRLPDGKVKALVQGVMKARVKKYTRHRSFFKVTYEKIVDHDPEDITIEIEALMKNVRENASKILSLRGEYTEDVDAILNNIKSPGKLADLVASNLRLKLEDSQEILELTDSVARLKKVNNILSYELELSAMQAKIQSDVKSEISKSQRDYFLREQMRAIHRELGDVDERMQEVEDYKKKITRARMPKNAKEEALKQVRRLEQMHPDSAESSVVRTYLDWLVELPWNRFTKDFLDIKRAKEVLDEDHLGLEKVKDRILEYLSVKKLNPKSKGPILCFVGPPGVGKTSLGRAIAKAMKRRFVRISLGGIHDEAEIRGHRRTYIGAMPGRILQGIKQAGTKNPVFMMDEIDKLGADFRGDPSSALLEALDPEQNASFSDHYLNIPFDLSAVMFILTANFTDTIPSALLDRMEVISISGYTPDEKLAIAKKHLVPRQVHEAGLRSSSISISDGALKMLISEYTQEAGLRNLEREIGSVCRKVARKMAEGKKAPFHITKRNITGYLGVPPFGPEMDREESQIGLSTGLAWTQVGGELLFVEATLVPGKGELIITGQIGEIMQESAKAALSYVKSRLKEMDVAESFFENQDIHIHVPAGAIPKDGPSAGIAIAAAMLSVVRDWPVKKDVAMTGEITLRGRLLPIGGLREKALGALLGGIRTIIIPEKNRKDLVELPAFLRKKIKFVPAKSFDDVIGLIFDGVDG